jgi:pimeloyl-ACP methyl ester carboxylesterase
MRSTIVLVHGAFAESATWRRVISELDGEHPVVAAANPLRGLAADAESVDDVVRSIDGPVVLVGHAYGGAVISNVSPESGNIAALVYVNGYAPQAGESCFALSTMFPGSRLGDAVREVRRRDGDADLTIAHEQFHEIFAADVPADEAAMMAVTQRPASRQALTEPSGDPLWTSVPSWFVYGTEDRIIPAAAHHFMAERAHTNGATRMHGASHAVAVSHPELAARVILEAASMVGTAV